MRIMLRIIIPGIVSGGRLVEAISSFEGKRKAVCAMRMIVCLCSGECRVIATTAGLI